VLFVSPNRIGDSVIASGVVREINRQWPGARITVAAGGPPAPFFRAAPGVERIIVVNKGRWASHWFRLWAEVVKQPWDVVIDTRGSALGWLIRAGTRRIYNRGWETGVPKVEVVSRLMGAPHALEPELYIDDRARAEAAAEKLAESAANIRETAQMSPEELGRKLTDDAIARPPDAAGAESLLYGLEREREALGAVNLRAEEEAAEYGDRLSAMKTERIDLTQAIAKLRDGIDELNAEGRERLIAAFDVINTNFKTLFEALFGGGQAELKLVESDDPLEAGLEIYACPPGKRLSVMSLMSGGEQALTAAALIFGVFLANPAPVCVLDEVDAPLDDANVDRFCRMLHEMRSRTDTRFIVITHNPVTMSRMDRLYGVTMPERGMSQLVSVDLQQAEEIVTA